MKLSPVIWLVVFLLPPAMASSQSLQPQSDPENQQPDRRLDVGSEPDESSLINLDGIVKARNKYSIEVDSEKTTHKVQLAPDARIRLRVISPRIDFEKKQLIIDVQGVEKRYRGYPISVPLYARISFVHQNQLKRVMKQPVKRLSDFELLATRPKGDAADKLIWIGELKPGESTRQLKFATAAGKSHDILLAKRGSMSGFRISDLKAEITAVRISGRIKDDGDVVAKDILFWPVSGYKKTARSN